MFLKALVLLPCFHVLRTENTPKTILWSYKEVIENGWQIGKYVHVIINTYLHKDPHCKIEFQDEKGASGDCLLLSFPGRQHRFVINSYVNGKWRREDSHSNIEIPTKIDVYVKAEDAGFKIKFKDKLYFRPYEFPLENIKIIQVACPGDSSIVAEITWSD